MRVSIAARACMAVGYRDKEIPMNGTSVPAASEAPDEYRLEKHLSDIKLELNNLIWMYGPPKMTLGEADKLACKLISEMVDTFGLH